MDKVLFLVGPHASGKTYSVKEFIKKNSDTDITLIDSGPIMREVHNKYGADKEIGEWVEEIEEKYGKDITSKIITSEVGRRMRKGKSASTIVIGYRTIQSILYTIKALKIPDFSILYIDASDELLYRNFISREGLKMDYESFKNYLNNELNSGLGQLKAMSLCGTENFKYFYKETNSANFDEMIYGYFGASIMKKSNDEVEI